MTVCLTFKEGLIVLGDVIAFEISKDITGTAVIELQRAGRPEVAYSEATALHMLVGLTNQEWQVIWKAGVKYGQEK